MKKIIQKGKYKLIQKRIVHYFCDKCGKRTGIKGNFKETWFGLTKEFHFCKKTCAKRRDE